MSTREIAPAARAAAEWWAEQVGAPTFRAVDAESGPEDQANMGMASMMQTLIAERDPVTEAAASTFADVLAVAITKRLSPYGVSLSVDYGPDQILYDAALGAGVASSRFPWKTHMLVNADHVTASLGYRARTRLIWSAPEWVRPTCGNREWPEDGPRDALCPKPRYHEDECGEWVPDPGRCTTCGQTYSGHYASQRGAYDHSWEVAS